MTQSPEARVVLLEFPDEAEAYLAGCRQQGRDPAQAHIISLTPKLHVWLAGQGIGFSNSLPYFKSESHGRALEKSHELLQWLETRVDLEDSLGISKAYSNALQWYSRFFLHHLLWLCEVLAEAQLQHPGIPLMAPVSQPHGSGSPFVQEHERYLGLLAQAHCLSLSLPFEAIELSKRSNREEQPENGARRLSWPGSRIGAPLHRAALRRMGRRRPLLALTHSYRIDDLVQEARRAIPSLEWVVLGEGGGSLRGVNLLRRALQAVTAGVRATNGRLYLGEVWPQILERSLAEDSNFAENLARSLDSLAQEAERDSELFSHRGVAFGPQFAVKIRTGIFEAMLRMHRQVRALDQVLELVKPQMVVTPFGRRSFHALGELCKRNGIPGLLVSHGSFTPMKNGLERMGWEFHSYGLFHGSYSHSALQTPLAGQFGRQVSSSAEFLKTGPLIWGLSAKGKGSPGLKTQLMPGRDDWRVVVHAGTQKHRGSMHFHIYETPDEYIAGIMDLILAVSEIPKVYAVIKYRPSLLSVDELTSLLPPSDRYCISVKEPFLDVLGFADLLVSFASTTIEEALQNRVPVLLYGGGGRYQHIEAFEVTPDISVEPRAVYTVRHPEHLADGLRRVLEVSGKPPLPAELFQEYIYRPEEITPFPDLVRKLVRQES